jgi:hypothetical protein
MDLKKLKNNFKFGCILLTAALFSQVQSVHAADTTVSNATTSNLTLNTNGDDVVINSGGSITTTSNNTLEVSASNTTITNNGTITNSVTGTGSVTVGNAIGNSGTLTTLENNGTISSTVTTTGDGGNGIVNQTTGTITSFINTGSITGSKRDGIDQLGIITTLTNSGTIRGEGFDGINNDDGVDAGQATITTLTNSGTIRGARHGIGQDDGKITNLTNSGIIKGDSTAGIYSGSSGVLTNIDNSGTIIGGTYGIRNNGGTLTTLTNSGTISGGTNSILNTGTLGSINLNKGSILIGTINSSTDTTLNMNVGASKSYAYSTSGAGSITLNDLNNRPAIAGSAYAVNIGSMEMAGENLYQNTSNIIDAIESNINTKETWVRPYYSESSRDAVGDSSAIRKFENSKQGFTIGGAVKNSNIPLQFVLNVDQSENNIDSGEHIIDSNSITLGLVAPNFNRVGSYNLSLKGLVGYIKNDTDRKILDNTSSTGERVIRGDYNSFNAIVGASLAKTINLDNGVKANITIGADVVSEMRDSYSESLYFSYDKLNLVQLQPKIQSEFVKTLNNTSNAFVKVGVEARELLSGKTQDFSANSIKTSYTTPTTNDVYGTVAVGFNSKINETINLFAEANARKSGEEVETYQAIFGIKGTF